MKTEGFGAVLVAAVVTVAAVNGQQQTVPNDVLQMLRMGPMSGTPGEIKAGPAPADFPSDVLPRGTVVVASQSNDRGTTVVGTLQALPSGWRNDYLASVGASGWMSQMPVMTGFTMSGTSNSASICKGTDFVMMSTTPRKGGGLYVRAAVTRDPRRLCQARPSGMDQYFADVAFPTLEAPPDVRPSGGGSSGSQEDWSTRTQLTTGLSLAVLAEHYRQQIAAAGWIEDGGPVSFDNVMISRYKVPSKLGFTIPALFIVTRFDGTQQYDLLLRVVRPNDRVGGPAVSGGVIIK